LPPYIHPQTIRRCGEAPALCRTQANLLFAPLFINLLFLPFCFGSWEIFWRKRTQQATRRDQASFFSVKGQNRAYQPSFLSGLSGHFSLLAGCPELCIALLAAACGLQKALSLSLSRTPGHHSKMPLVGNLVQPATLSLLVLPLL
jgi:hypothetical protein